MEDFEDFRPFVCEIEVKVEEGGEEGEGGGGEAGELWGEIDEMVIWRVVMGMGWDPAKKIQKSRAVTVATKIPANFKI